MLVPCEACGRHLRARESRCPFCLADRAPRDVAEPAPPRLSRAALMMAGSIALSGCPLAVRYGGPPPSAAPAQVAPPPAAPDASSDAARKP
ncbi:MAG: hypothetical protein U0324_19750 [Polyangiales bacterium]